MKRINIVVLYFACLFSVVALSCTTKQFPEKKDLVLAVNVTPYSAPVYIALAKNFWKEEGLNVTKKGFAAGRFNLEAVLGGKADFGTVAESPMVFAGLTGQKALIAATIATGDNDMKIIARRDHGISTPADLKGKKIGTSVSTTADFFLYSFLKRNSMSMSDIKLVNLKPAELPSAIINGDVDAISAWEPFVYNSEKTLGEKSVTFAAKGLYDATFNVVINEDFAQKYPGTVKAILRGLLKAEKFMTTNRKEAVEI
ncbi:MAG TPA: NrtA/SsuA/CpmA family ABC transporter substrate-binding protein, partial [Thermodesulfovibrionales bacterium]|nr:NrtA/SsuA/CpmA family ABC transporter substrate-binding protein [Thermodesulfovibrionales bacterium]